MPPDAGAAPGAASRLRRVAAGLVVPVLLATGCAAGVSDDDLEIDSTSATAGDDGTETAQQADDGTADATGGEDPGDEGGDEPDGALLLIMDASGSMQARDADDVTLLDGAKQALRDVVDELPDGTHAGLRVYGHRVPNTDRENGCADTELVHPVSELDRDAMLDAIDGFDALGFTPIGASLEAAVDDLPPEGPRTIILVSDGEDTCAPPDPCTVAEDVRAEGIDLVIHTVGFALDGGDDGDGARTELECIAEAGGGEFRDAPSAADLADVLTEVSEREVRRYVPTGLEIEGTPIPRDAATGEVDTPHVDTVMGEEVNFYRFEIEPGSVVRGEMVIAGNPHADDDSIYFCPNVELTDEADQSHAHGPFPGGRPSETYIKHTDDVAVHDAEVWLKVESAGCSGMRGPGNSQFDLELQLTVVEPGG